MTIIKGVTSIIMVSALLAALTAVLLTPVSAQAITMQPWTLTYAGASTATIGVPYTIHWKVNDSSGDNDPMPSNFISLTVDGVVVAQPALPSTTASAMDATATYTFTTPGTHTLGISIPRFVSSEDGDIWPASSATATVNVGGGQVTVSPPTVAPPVVTPIVIQVPTVVPQNIAINYGSGMNTNFGSGTIITGTDPVTGLPAATLTQQTPGKLHEVTVRYASDPAQLTDAFNKQSASYLANGYTQTAKGQRMYNDPSLNYQYARFAKGSSTINLQGVGNNSTNAYNGIKGDVLISESDQTFDTGGLFGLSQWATWALFIVAAAAVLGIIFFLIWYRRRKKEEEEENQQPEDEGQNFDRYTGYD